MKEFKFFDRERVPAVVFAGMMQYDGDLKIPEKFLVNPPRIDNTVSEYLVASGVRQLPYLKPEVRHVTYFWNGNRTEKFDEASETYFEVPSDRVEFNELPWMKGAEITDKVIETIEAEGMISSGLIIQMRHGGHTGILKPL
jgi:2,3-bisphosphoglycerate-independent phosphoglycerate mutase